MQMYNQDENWEKEGYYYNIRIFPDGTRQAAYRLPTHQDENWEKEGCAMTMNKFMADVDDLIFDGQEQSHSER